MKKVSVITMHCVKNYGSVLQTYATQKLITGMGYDCEIVDFWRNQSLDENLVENWTKNKPFYAKLIMLPTLSRWKKVFNTFLKENIKLSPKKYIQGVNEEELKNLESDIYCVGSDQVWNTDWNNGLISEYFLSYAKKSNKFALASSMGKEVLSDEENEFFKKYLTSFKSISVREDSARIALENIGIKSTTVLDPTLCLEPNEWEDIIEKRLIKKDYVLVYQLNKNKKFDEYAEKFAKENKLKLVRLCFRYDQMILLNGHGIFPTPGGFLSLFKYASAIITDSFHGLAFSINFNRNVNVIYPPKFSSRLNNILQITGLEERVVKDYNDLKLRPIDYTHANQILKSRRDEMKSWLKNVLNDFE